MTLGTYTDTYADYLRRIGITRPGAPSKEGLFALQRAHVQRIPFENTEIQIGRPPGIDPRLSVRRLSAGRGGYCFHLNGAFAALLEELGYDVTRHLGGVYADPTSRAVSGDHLTLSVRVDGATWFVDVGLGNGPLEPLPLRAGSWTQNFGYALEPLAGAEGDEAGWTLRTDNGPFPVMNFRSAPAAMADFEAEHLRLSTAPDSPFRQSFIMLRRHDAGVDRLAGRMLSRMSAGGDGTARELATPEEFFVTIGEVFGRELDDLSPEDRTALWERVDRAHQAWLASKAAG
ncbi:arylamine N-acetyltransferase [Streptomyces sp. RerS4]|uniref:arylamine N-acetyltransferase family protein n=1 Tax=Streptomyces sp. RerS4 TaxID=2942449 RepID=UPI00201BD5F6|nr:arylamine N-acetyltransferase [Streptomyces sp. RerS4]UQX01701.1 arylamine N-acetyltransferase [Streptomyces sp. RerS4]